MQKSGNDTHPLYFHSCHLFPTLCHPQRIGREYTALVSGSSATGIKVYKVLERVFRSEIPERERMLTHDMKWGENSYGSDETVKTAQWWMQVCSDTDQERLQAIAKSIYASFGGNGYCRMDLREDHRSGEVYVVDVNGSFLFF